MADFGADDPVVSGDFGKNDAIVKQRYQTWPERLVRGAISSLASGATLPGDVAGGNQMLTEENVGNLSPGGFMVNPQRTLDLAAMGPVSAAARAGEAAIPGTATRLAKEPVSAPAPTRPELKTEYNAQYKAARDSDLTLDPKGVSALAGIMQKRLEQEGFTGGPDGTSPKTLAILGRMRGRGGSEPDMGLADVLAESFGGDAKDFAALQDLRPGQPVTAPVIDSIRKSLGRLSRETNEGKPTSDAAAATAALKDFNVYTENIPQSHILAGSPETYISNTKLGNQNYMAAQQLRDAENRINAAKANYEGSITARLDNQLKAQFRPILKSEAKQRGLTDEQIQAVDNLNKGSLVQRGASQIGRFTPFSPVGAALHFMSGSPFALATGGGSIIPQLMIGAGIHGARKLGEGLAMRQARAIADLAAKRSALFDQRMAEQTANAPFMVPGLNQNASLLRTFLLDNQGQQ